MRNDVAMTGEVSLTGRVLPIGGVKQKLLAAHRAGITDVLLPARNEPDLDDVPAAVREMLTVHLVSDVREVLALALEPATTTAAGGLSLAAPGIRPGARAPPVHLDAAAGCPRDDPQPAVAVALERDLGPARVVDIGVLAVLQQVDQLVACCRSPSRVSGTVQRSGPRLCTATMRRSSHAHSWART